MFSVLLKFELRAKDHTEIGVLPIDTDQSSCVYHTEVRGLPIDTDQSSCVHHTEVRVIPIDTDQYSCVYHSITQLPILQQTTLPP
jgi:hypothetical protein